MTAKNVCDVFWRMFCKYEKTFGEEYQITKEGKRGKNQIVFVEFADGTEMTWNKMKIRVKARTAERREFLKEISREIINDVLKQEEI